MTSTVLRCVNTKTTIIQAIHSLLSDGNSIDVRVRCGDHEPTDGLGAHKLILAAASPILLRNVLEDSTDELACIHLPDFTSEDVGPVISLLYFGEIWQYNDSAVQQYRDILRLLGIEINLEELVSEELISETDLKLIESQNVDTDPLVDVKFEEFSTPAVTFKNETDLSDVTPEVPVVMCKVEPPDDDFQDDVTISNRIVTAVSYCTEKDCSFSTSSLSSFQTHRLVHQRRFLIKQMKLSCPACGFPASDKKMLLSHVFTVHGQVRGDEVDCQTCNFAGKKENFFEHISLWHSDSDKQFYRRLFCDFPECYFVTEKSSNLTQHLRIHNEEKSFSCSHCGLRFRSSSHVKVHFRSHHCAARRLNCPICDQSCATSLQLKRHQLIHDKIHDDKTYTCLHCKQTFKKSQSLAGHIRSHHGREVEASKHSAQSICHKCGKIFSSLAKLRNHRCLKLEECSADVSLPCHVCNKIVSKSSLKNHLYYHQKKMDGLHTCHVCHQGFSTFASLQRHQLIHQDEKPFKCQVCEKRFRQNSSLQCHNRVHTGFRFECSRCPSKFITKSLLNQHLKAKINCRQRK